MKKQTLSGSPSALLALLLLAASALGQAGYDKVLYLDPPLATSCLAVEIATPEGQALTGLRWWHNDANVAFPKLVLMEGDPVVGPDLSNSALVLLEIVGASLSWGVVDFGGAVTSSTGTAYAVFYYPEGEATTGIGPGKGPGIGVRQESGPPFYLSGDETKWVRFDATYAIGIEPIYGSGKTEPRVLADLRKQRAPQEQADNASPSVQRTELLDPRPNPFNPRVELAFTMATTTRAELVIYDLRGREVVTLLDELRPSGAHSVVWEGRDQKGREVSSGVYFARLTAGERQAHKRLVLVS